MISQYELSEMATEFNAAPADAEWGPGHPIFKLAEENDKLREEVARLNSAHERYCRPIMNENEYLRAECERLRQDVKQQGYLAAVNKELNARLKAENKRLLTDPELIMGRLEIVTQAFREVAQAREVGEMWYSDGARGMRKQVAMWVDKGQKAICDIDAQLAKDKTL